MEYYENIDTQATLSPTHPPAWPTAYSRVSREVHGEQAVGQRAPLYCDKYFILWDIVDSRTESNPNPNPNPEPNLNPNPNPNPNHEVLTNCGVVKYHWSAVSTVCTLTEMLSLAI